MMKQLALCLWLGLIVTSTVKAQNEWELHAQKAKKAYETDDFNTALTEWTEAIKKAESQLGVEHPTLAELYYNLGLTYAGSQKYNQALQAYDRALKIFTKYEDLSTQMASCFYYRAVAYTFFRDLDSAAHDFNKSLQIRLTSYKTEDHPEVALSYNGLGGLYAMKQNYQQAMEYYQKSLKIRLNVYKDQPHQDLVQSYSNIATTYIYQGHYDLAVVQFKRSIEIAQKLYGNNHVDVGRGYLGIGAAYFNKQEFQKALENHQQSLKVFLATYKIENHKEVAFSYDNIGASYEKLGNKEAAKVAYDKSYSIRKKLLKP